MKQFEISIPTPCNKGWENMTQSNGGKYCDSCSQVVVDFTKMDAEEIKEFLLSKQNQSVCGHFKNDQLKSNRPKLHQFFVNLYEKTEHNFNVPVFKKLSLTGIVFCMFVIGCSRPKALEGKVVTSVPSKPEQTAVELKNTTKKSD